MPLPHKEIKVAPGALARRFTLLLILLTVIPSGLSKSSAQNSSLGNLYITGQYLYQGRLPPEMKDVFAISLIANDSRGRKTRLTGYVSAAGEKYSFISVRLDGDKLTFSSRTINGVSFKFEGRILKIRIQEGDYDSPELEGTLTKLRNSEKIGQLTGRFKYEEFGD